LTKVAKAFEKSSFNRYQGPQNPELIIVCSGVGTRYALEAVHSLNLGKSVGLLKLGTLWPFPREFVEKHLSKTKQVLVVEEIDPFLETFIKKTAFESATLSGDLKVYGKESGHLPKIGELRPDLVIKALATLFETEYIDREADYQQKVSDASEKLLIDRGVTWCAGCPHRASFWSLKKALQKDGRDGFLTGDIGCYTLDVFPAGDKLIKALHAMGSGVGLATGFGQLSQFGSEQPVVAVCGDSTFFHSSIPALLNAIHNKSNMTLIVLDNRATAMTGFQSHPGTAFDAMGNKAPAIDMANLCQSLGCKVVITDPFDIKGTTAKLRRLLKEDKVKVLIMRRTCELVRMREEKKPPYTVWVDAEKCRGEDCGFCTRSFKCPALPWDIETEKAVINKAVCSGCGVCVDICPFGAIVKQEVS
jgi:indolepyruvate ferredoxin oxidoreductase alpha subunit